MADPPEGRRFWPTIVGMTSAERLPPIPPAESVAHVSLPKTLIDPGVDGPERTRLLRALKGVEIAAPSSGQPARPAERRGDRTDLRELGMVGALVYSVVTVTVAPFVVPRNRIALNRIRQARRAGRLIVPIQDLDVGAQVMLRVVLEAVRQVSGSRAQRDGQLADGLALLQDQQWRIASALTRLTEARRLLDRTGGRLAEHHDAVRATEEAVERRVRAVLGYAESVRQVDATLADVDAASYTVTLDHKLRDTLAALGEDQTLDQLTSDSRNARTAVEEALQSLRRQTELLRSTDNEVS